MEKLDVNSILFPIIIGGGGGGNFNAAINVQRNTCFIKSRICIFSILLDIAFLKKFCHRLKVAIGNFKLA